MYNEYFQRLKLMLAVEWPAHATKIEVDAPR